MSRNKPTANIDVIGHLDLAPENAAGSYIQSKQQNEFFIKPPNCDSAGDTIELFLIRCQQEHDAMLQLQADLLTDMNRHVCLNANRIRRINKIQLNLRKRLVEVSSFLKDCDDKRNTADKKINGELEQHATISKDMERCLASINVLVKFREQLKSTVRDFEPYERVMEDVVQKSDSFVSVKDCTDRCDALMLTQVEINALEQEKVQDIEEMHKRMTKIINDAALTVMGLQNDLAELDRSYTQLNHNCEKWEKTLTISKDVIAQNDFLKASTIGGVRLMYVMLCRRKHTNPILQRHEVEGQLDFIKAEIDLLQEVCEICNTDTTGSTMEKYNRGSFIKNTFEKTNKNSKH